MEGAKYTIDSNYEAEFVTKKKKTSSMRPIKLNRSRGHIKLEEFETPNSNIPRLSLSHQPSPILFTPISSQITDNNHSQKLPRISSVNNEDYSTISSKQKFLGRLVLERFQNSAMAQYFICQLCDCVCNIGFLECQVCSSLFCKECLYIYTHQNAPNTCPKCETSNQLALNEIESCFSGRYVSSPSLAMIHSLLEVECKHIGCSHIVILKDLAEHERRCDWRYTPCKLKKIKKDVPGCLDLVRANDEMEGYCSVRCQLFGDLVDGRTNHSYDEHTAKLIELIKMHRN
ncbi:unnamed protein product [Blepharisma stoltei]|uniref:RING-type domain-containing protein n=1 Tax=Blepharisma stoltei TaxID=1481888 RepID=A0AAU9IQT6_9CILI|nr:unnamed protein product [Blepharisma stoltei]